MTAIDVNSPKDGFARIVWTALGGAPPALDRLRFLGEGDPCSAFAVGDLAAASIGVAGLAIADCVAAGQGGAAPAVEVNRRLAALWFGTDFAPVGWAPPPAWDPIAGDYRTSDGWIRLHTNAPHHRAAALRVLGVDGDKDAVTRAVAGWAAYALEAAVVADGGCAAAMRDMAAWRAHANGAAVAAEPPVWFEDRAAAPVRCSAPVEGPVEPPVAGRPLAGIRVLDLTRVLAGPVATRFLAGYGADVLRIDSPWWDEPALLPGVTLGKRCARLDLRQSRDMAVFRGLLADADVLVHGYRPGALARLGLHEAARRAIRPGLIDVCHDAYGWTGPWRERRGFDSLVQMSSGIAAEGMRRFGAVRPTPLPVQALDHAAGYIVAAAVARGLARRFASGAGLAARTSLARVAALLASGPIGAPGAGMAPADAADFQTETEATAWGPAHRMRPPVAVFGAPMRWDFPAGELGTSEAVWLSRE